MNCVRIQEFVRREFTIFKKSKDPAGFRPADGYPPTSPSEDTEHEDKPLHIPLLMAKPLCV
jgi:hypothetical protein